MRAGPTLLRRDGVHRSGRGRVRTRGRIVPQRRDLAGAAARVDRDAAFALPGVRHADREPRQHPGRLVADPARALPALRRARSRSATRSSSCSPACCSRRSAPGSAHSWALPAFLVLTAALIAISAIDLEHFIIPNRIVYPVGFASVVLLAFAALLEHDWTLVRPRAARRGAPRSRSSSSCTSSRRAAWASATCGCRSSSGCSSAGSAGA